jgi:hypothetical protein
MLVIDDQFAIMSSLMGSPLSAMVFGYTDHAIIESNQFAACHNTI